MKISRHLHTVLLTSVAISGKPALAQSHDAHHPIHETHPFTHDAHHPTLTPFLCDPDNSDPKDDGSASFVTVGHGFALQLRHHTDESDAFDPIEPGAIINGAAGQTFNKISFVIDNCPSLSIPDGGLGVDVIFSPPPFNSTQFATATCTDGIQSSSSNAFKIVLEGDDFSPNIPKGSRILKIGFSSNAAATQSPQTFRITNVFLNGVAVIFDTHHGTTSNCPFYPFDPASG